MPAPDHPSSSSVAARAASLYFTLSFGAGLLLGAVRVPLLVPRIGERLAELAEMPLMFLVIYFAARHVAARYDLPPGGLLRVKVGALALLFMVGAELLLAVVVAGRGAGEYISGRDPVSGSVYLAMLLVYAAMPWMQARGRARNLTREERR